MSSNVFTTKKCGILRIGTPAYTSYCTKRQCCITYQTIEEDNGPLKLAPYKVDHYICTISDDAEEVFKEITGIYHECKSKD